MSKTFVAVRGVLDGGEANCKPMRAEIFARYPGASGRGSPIKNINLSTA